MTDRGHRQPDPDQVRELLRREADAHRPDVEGILARVEQARTRGPGVPGAFRAVPGGGRPGGWDVPLACAAVAALLVVGVATAQRLPTRDPAGPPAGAGPTVGGTAVADPVPATAPTASRTPSRTSSRPGPAPSGDRSGTAAPSSTRRHLPSVVTPPTTRAPDVAEPVLHLTSVGRGTEVTLPRAGDRDWMIVGARRDGKVIRAKSGTGEIVGVSPEGADATVVPGPLRVAWSGGAPEQDRSGVTTWWSVPSGTARQQIVVRLREPATIDLFVGVGGPGEGPRGTLVAAVSAPGRGPALDGPSATLAVPSSDGAAVVSVRVDDVVPGSTVTLTLSGARDGGELAVSAVAVR